jgi:hypothetical protein
MFPPKHFTCLIASLFIIAPSFAQETSLQSAVMHKFRQDNGGDTALYAITLNLSLKKGETMYLKDYGPVEKSGPVSFLTGDTILRLYTPSRDQLKQTIDAGKYITYTQAADALSLPDPATFGENVFREEVIANDAEFENNLRQVLNKYFAIGYTRMEQGDKTTIITPYYILNLPSSLKKVGKCAFKLVYKLNSGTQKLYRISTVVRQRRSHEVNLWTEGSDKTILDKTLSLQNDIIKQINP